MIRIKELELTNHPILGNLKIKMSESSDTALFYNTLIIGQNGSGKSFILQAIVNIFRELAYYVRKRERRQLVGGGFYIKYELDKKEIEFGNINYLKEYNSKGIVKIGPIPGNEKKHPLTIKINRESYSEENIVPCKILALSTIFTDKFPAVIDESILEYKYLGIRSIKSPSNASTRTLNKKLVETLLEHGNNIDFITTLGTILKNLGYKPTISISYIPKYRNIFYQKNISTDSFINMFENWGSTFPNRKAEPWGLYYFNSIKDDLDVIKNIVDLLNTKPLLDYGSGGKYIKYDLLSEELDKYEFQTLQHLHKLDLLSFPEVNISKNDEAFTLSESSSGEQNIILLLLNILSEIDNNTLLLIDEPEVSLHPNWQMQYISILNKALSNYNGYHCIIATHSHFLVSDLNGSNSHLIGLTKKSNEISTIPFPPNIDTFGWSAEDVLYNIFNVRSSINYYLQADLTELLGMISNDIRDKAKIKLILDKLVLLPQRPNDPLQEIIKEATEYYNSLQ